MPSYLVVGLILGPILLAALYNRLMAKREYHEACALIYKSSGDCSPDFVLREMELRR